MAVVILTIVILYNAVPVVKQFGDLEFILQDNIFGYHAIRIRNVIDFHNKRNMDFVLIKFSELAGFSDIEIRMYFNIVGLYIPCQEVQIRTFTPYCIYIVNKYGKSSDINFNRRTDSVKPIDI